MREFLLMVVITTLFLGGFFLLQGILRVPRYRLERADFRALLTDALAGEARLERWEMIIGMPVRHDPQLERWRERLVQLAENGRPGRRDRGGSAYCHFSPEETALLRRILQEMDCAESGPTHRAF